MSNGAKIALASVVAFVLAASVEILYIHHERVQDANATAVSRDAVPEAKMDDDEVVQLSLRKERPDSIQDERKLIGKTLWVSAAEQMDYYRDTGNHVDYARPVGVLEGADPLIVTGVFEQKAPAAGRAVMRIPAGQRQVLLAFTLPKSAAPTQAYAVPVGDYEDGVYQIKTDDIFFYDDPRTLYHWPASAWQHIDQHDVALGMTEDQCMLAIGQVLTFNGDTPGNRSITFDHLGHQITVTFENGKATKIV